MSDDIYTILERIKALDKPVAPIASVRETRKLDPQQKTVHQLPRLFMPKSINVLSNKDNPQHPAKNYFVGENIAVRELSLNDVLTELQPPIDVTEQIGEGKKVGEDKLAQVKKGLTDYLKDLEDIKTDSDLKDKEQDQTDLELQTKEKALDLSLYQNHPVKSVTMQNGNVCEVHGNENDGFCIRHKQKEMPSRFSNIDEALMAIEMYNAHMRDSLLTADYIEEK